MPTYILNMSYNIAPSWNSSSGVFKGQTQNSTNSVTIGFDNWGDFHVQRVDDKLTSLSWNGQKLTLKVSSSTSGSIELYCGSRGLPERTSGLSSAAYSVTTKILQGIYAANGTVELDWATNPQNPEAPPPPTVSFSASTEGIGKLAPGTNVTFKILIQFTSSSYTVNTITFTGSSADWCTVITSLPVIFTRGADDEASEIDVSLAVPANTAPGTYNALATIYGVDPFGNSDSSTLPLNFLVEKTSPSLWTSIGKVDTNIAFTIIIIVAMIVVAAVALAKRR